MLNCLWFRERIGDFVHIHIMWCCLENFNVRYLPEISAEEFIFPSIFQTFCKLLIFFSLAKFQVLLQQLK